MIRLITVYNVICLFEMKRHQTFTLLKGATYDVFVFRSLLH